MRVLSGLVLGLIMGLAGQNAVLADDAALIESIFRTQAETVAKADSVYKRAVDKARDDALLQLMKLTVKAYKAKDRVAETAAWKAVLRLDRTHKKAIQYFTDLGTLDKVLAELPAEEGQPAAPAKGKPATTAELTGPEFQKWLTEVAALPGAQQTPAVMQKLVLLNPQFDGKATPELTDGVVTSITLSSDKLVNLAPLRAFSGLVKLVCPATNPKESQLEDLAPLKGLPLSHLDINNTHVSDLSPLAGMKLTYLNCDFTSVSDLSPLKGMPLSGLNCQSTRVEDLAPLKGMTLVNLNCSYTNIDDLSPLTGMSMGSLHIIQTKVADLSPLKGMKLGVVSMTDSQVSDLKPLAGMPITGISVNGTKVTDLSPLRGIAIEVLYCQNTKIGQLSPLKGMPLKRLYCDLKLQSDIPILRGIKTLETINDVPVAEFWAQRGFK